MGHSERVTDLVLLLEGEGEAVDDAAQDLQQLSHAIVLFRLPDESEEDVVDGFPHKRPVHHKLPIYPAQKLLPSARVGPDDELRVGGGGVGRAEQVPKSANVSSRGTPSIAWPVVQVISVRIMGIRCFLHSASSADRA
jgi:hypothetical protein